MNKNVIKYNIVRIIRQGYPKRIRNIGTSDEYIALVVERFQKKLDEFNSKKILLTRLSVSIGVTYCDPDCPYSVANQLDKADQAMYEQKGRKKKP